MPDILVIGQMAVCGGLVMQPIFFLPQRHLNPWLQFSRRLCRRMPGNAVEYRNGNRKKSNGCRVRG